MARRITFYADSIDLSFLCKTVEERHDIKYYQAGRFVTDEIPYYKSLLELPDLGVSKGFTSVLVDYFLILPVNTQLNVREVAQHSGGVNYFIDQLHNPNSLIIRTGGFWEKKAVIPSAVGTLSTSESIMDIFREFAKQVRKFKRVQSIAVGPNAYNYLLQGFRLTDDIRSPDEHDLRLL